MQIANSLKDGQEIIGSSKTYDQTSKIDRLINAWGLNQEILSTKWNNEILNTNGGLTE